MAAMISSQLVDPGKTAKYPITISEQLLREDRPRKRQRVSVQFNHRLTSSGGTKATITPSQSGDESTYNASVAEVERGVYEYTGSQHPIGATALFYNHEEQSFTLDRIDTEFRFNLRSTPSNKDAASLATQYPQLDTGLPEPENEGDNPLEEPSDGDQNPEDAAPDPNNPYDYRHYLKWGNSPSPEHSTTASPMPQSTHNGSPILLDSPAVQESFRSSRPEQRSRPRYLSPSRREEADADNEESDPNELVIDMGDSAMTQRPWRSTLGILNEGGRNTGPVSLRSVASSMSPSIRGESEDEKEKVHSDTDVEEIDLGDGGVDFVTGDARAQAASGWDDDEGDLEAELEQALENQADEDSVNGGVVLNGGQDAVVTNGWDPGTEVRHVVAESSSESEEE